MDSVEVIENENFDMKNDFDKEEELCQLVINILFTIMWRGRTKTSEAPAKERGCVIGKLTLIFTENPRSGVSTIQDGALYAE